jgi:menaquinone-dependent protoporphyrinogen IX oxidase
MEWHTKSGGSHRQSVTRRGQRSKVVDAKNAPLRIEAYDLILVGSGLRADKWTKESEAL